MWSARRARELKPGVGRVFGLSHAIVLCDVRNLKDGRSVAFKQPPHLVSMLECPSLLPDEV